MLSSRLVLNLKTRGAALSAAALVLFSTSMLSVDALAVDYDGKPAPLVASEQAKELKDVGIDEKLGSKVDLNLQFKNESGQTVALGSFFDGKHPVILSPVYFACPGLCSFHLNGLTDALKLMDKNWSVGDKYQVVSVSFDSKETPELAADKKQLYMKSYGREGADKGWHFLTTDELTVQTLTKSLGFKFKWDEAAKEWAHASAAVILTPDGTISRYLPGIMFQPQDIKLALNEATAGKIGNFVEHLVLYCFKYDPQQSRYALVAFNVMKMGGALMVLLMGLWLLPTYIRSRKQNKTAGR